MAVTFSGIATASSLQLQSRPYTCPMPRRSRHLLRPSLNSRTCGEDSQVRPCLLNENCFQFQYNLTEWSTCQLSENASCGQGVRTRLLSCVRSDGKPVGMDHCRMSRTRFIIMPTQGEGRQCPTELTQQKPCPVMPCYSWVLGNWSACKLEGGDCGEGVQVRSFSCVVHNGSLSHTAVHVGDALCGEVPFQEGILKQLCSVPCPVDAISFGGEIKKTEISKTSKKPKPHQSTPRHQKPLTLAYDGDLDM
ncbi:Thrombospondin type-1 domain-containing protein 7B [Cricetulus griseus]|uniref:Thrombospondin type-1 domain-containing protein 7B n=1 Tax=Cricetulus griseus TaxID=10029 RepID=G3GZR4_CRIGR|nr:Thrombospondin type-1 domain-containing protein 7B [Cricetulus griseus]